MKTKKVYEEYGEGWIDYPGVGIITDGQVADLVIKHTTWFDWIFRRKKIVSASLWAQNMLMKVVDEPKTKWKF